MHQTNCKNPVLVLCDHWTGQRALSILLSARYCFRLSWEWWLYPLHLLRPVLLGCYWLQLSSLSSVIVLQPPLLYDEWGGHSLCLFGDSLVLMDLHWPCDCTAQSSILSIGSVSLVLLWGNFWTILDSSSFPLFTVVKSFTSWYALLLLFFLRFPSIHYTVLLSSFLLPFSYTSWCCCSLPCISQILQVWIFSFSVLSFCRTVREFLQWHRFFFIWCCLPRISLAVSVTAVFKMVITVSMSVSSLFMMMTGANFPSIIAWKVSNTLGSFSFSRSNLNLVCFVLLIFLDEGGRSLSASCGHFQCLLLENLVFWHCSLLIRSASPLACNQSGCVVHLGYARSIFWMLCDDQKCSPTQDR